VGRLSNLAVTTQKGDKAASSKKKGARRNMQYDSATLRSPGGDGSECSSRNGDDLAGFVVETRGDNASGAQAQLNSQPLEDTDLRPTLVKALDNDLCDDQVDSEPESVTSELLLSPLDVGEVVEAVNHKTDYTEAGISHEEQLKQPITPETPTSFRARATITAASFGAIAQGKLSPTSPSSPRPSTSVTTVGRPSELAITAQKGDKAASKKSTTAESKKKEKKTIAVSKKKDARSRSIAASGGTNSSGKAFKPRSSPHQQRVKIA